MTARLARSAGLLRSRRSVIVNEIVSRSRNSDVARRILQVAHTHIGAPNGPVGYLQEKSPITRPAKSYFRDQLKCVLSIDAEVRCAPSRAAPGRVGSLHL
jgi:hypothetical protein